MSKCSSCIVLRLMFPFKSPILLCRPGPLHSNLPETDRTRLMTATVVCNSFFIITFLVRKFQNLIKPNYMHDKMTFCFFGVLVGHRLSDMTSWRSASRRLGFFCVSVSYPVRYDELTICFKTIKLFWCQV